MRRDNNTETFPQISQAASGFIFSKRSCCPAQPPAPNPSSAIMADAEGISIEETNRIRISFGLKPLEVAPTAGAPADSLTVDDEERIAHENLKALRAEQTKKAEEDALRSRLKKARDRKALNEKLTGKTLADAEGEEEDLTSWIKKTKRREKELAAQRAKELESQDKLFQEEYTEKDLEGLKVGHDFGDIEEGEGVILTIKDRDILDDDESGDELISTSLAEKERLKEHLDNKIRKPKYDPYAEEYDEDTGEKKILSKYDEDIDGGPKRKAFVLGKSQGASSTQKEKHRLDPSSNLKAISLEYDRPMEIASDYMDPSTIKIKKPKKKKVKSTKISALVDEEGLLPTTDPDAMVEDAVPIAVASVKRTYNEDSGFGDDEELQEMLAQRRRQQQKKRKYTRPEDIVRNIKQQMDEDDAPTPDGGLVIDDTSEFVRGIEMTQQDEPETKSRRKSETAMDIDPDATVVHENGDTEMPDEQLPDKVDEPVAVLEDEPIVGGSVAATLAALKRKGDLTDHNPSSNFSMTDLQKREEILSRQRQRQIELELEARKQREAERLNERWNRMSQREREQYREQQNQRREKEEARRRMEEFNEIKFNVELEYRDEFGHEMTPKDAFKKLSHTFHGKGSGTMKRGKYLQKVQEQSKSAVSGSAVGDLEKTNSLRERQKAQGTAYTRIQ